MGRRKKQIPEVPAIDYKKQIAEEYAKEILLLPNTANLASFIVTAINLVFKNKLDFELETREFMAGQILYLSRMVISVKVAGWSEQDKIDSLVEDLIYKFQEFGYEKHDSCCQKIQRMYAAKLDTDIFCQGALNDMHAGLKMIAVINEALEKMDELSVVVNLNGKLIEVPK